MSQTVCSSQGCSSASQGRISTPVLKPREWPRMHLSLLFMLAFLFTHSIIVLYCLFIILWIGRNVLVVADAPNVQIHVVN